MNVHSFVLVEYLTLWNPTNYYQQSSQFFMWTLNPFLFETREMCAYSAKKCTHGKTYEGYHKSRMSFQHLTRKIWTWNKVAWRESQQERKTAPEKLKRCSKVYKTTLNRMAFWNNLCWLVLIITYLFFVTFLCLEHWGGIREPVFRFSCIPQLQSEIYNKDTPCILKFLK